MSDPTYRVSRPRADKPLVWVKGEIKTPPFSKACRIEAGMLLRRLQQGETLGLPHSRPMPNIGPQCHELRVRAETLNWRIIYHISPEAIVILDVHPKTTRRTPNAVIGLCAKRLQLYLSIS